MYFSCKYTHLLGGLGIFAYSFWHLFKGRAPWSTAHLYLGAVLIKGYEIGSFVFGKRQTSPLPFTATHLPIWIFSLSVL